MAIPKEQIKQISCRDFFRQHVGPLQQKGRRYWANCPFHQEKTASMVVDENRFHCFGCGADGDIFELAKKIWSVGFADAVHQLADEYGITAEKPIPKRRKPTKDPAAEFHAAFEKMFQVREVLKTELRRYKPGDEIPAALVLDLGEAAAIIGELVEEDAARRSSAHEEARRLLQRCLML